MKNVENFEGTKGFTKFLSSIYSINENKNIYKKNKGKHNNILIKIFKLT